MKRLLATVFSAFIAFAAFSQENPVKWSTKAEKQSDGIYKITISAAFGEPWHIYSQKTPDGGPVPTTFTFNKNPLVTFTGQVQEKGELKTTHDKNFGVDVKYYSGKVDFIQTVKVKGNVKTNITGTVNFMVCNDHECLPPSDYAFSVKLP